jgi:hypothetical protein
MSTITRCGVAARNAYSRLSTRANVAVWDSTGICAEKNLASCVGRAGSDRSKMTIEPAEPSVATTRRRPSSEICTSPRVKASVMIIESWRTGVRALTSQIFTALPAYAGAPTVSPTR